MKANTMGTDAQGRYLIPLNEFAARVCLSRETVYRKINNGELPAPIKQGRLSFYTLADVEIYLGKLKRKLETKIKRK